MFKPSHATSHIGRRLWGPLRDWQHNAGRGDTSLCAGHRRRKNAHDAQETVGIQPQFRCLKCKTPALVLSVSEEGTVDDGGDGVDDAVVGFCGLRKDAVDGCEVRTARFGAVGVGEKFGDETPHETIPVGLGEHLLAVVGDAFIAATVAKGGAGIDGNGRRAPPLLWPLGGAVYGCIGKRSMVAVAPGACGVEVFEGVAPGIDGLVTTGAGGIFGVGSEGTHMPRHELVEGHVLLWISHGIGRQNAAEKGDFAAMAADHVVVCMREHGESILDPIERLKRLRQGDIAAEVLREEEVGVGTKGVA
ncbi:MAG: hypothetical protein ACI8W8_004211 [Rhodothermales bacterium]|jgi:hypothetical protein